MPLLRGRSASWSANMSSNSRNLKLPSLTTRYLYWSNRSASWSANMSSNSWNLKSPFLTIRCLYWRGRSASWLANMSSNNRNVKSPFLTAKCLYWGVFLPVNWPILALTVEISSVHSWTLDASTGGRSASWDANMSSNSRNLKSQFLTHRCLYWRGRSASWSVNMSSNTRNLKSPMLNKRGLYWGVDLPVDLPIFALTLEISCHHSWPLDASTRGVPAGCSLNLSSNSRNLKSQFLTTRCLYWGVDLPVPLIIWALTVEISSHHSWSLDTSTRGVDLLVALLNMSSNSRNFKLHNPLTTRCLYWGVDLPVNRPIWALTVEISSQHYWPLDASTGG